MVLPHAYTIRDLTRKLKTTVENPRGSVEKLSPKESAECGDTALRGSVRVLRDFPRV